MGIYQFILKPRLTHSVEVWEERIKKNTEEAVLVKMRGLVLSRATRSTLNSIPEAISSIGPLQNSIIVKTAKPDYRIKDATESNS